MRLLRFFRAAPLPTVRALDPDPLRTSLRPLRSADGVAGGPLSRVRGAQARVRLRACVERPAADVIAYIPPDPNRQLRRREHPAERLAADLADRWQLEARPLLVRARRVPRQTGLSLGERRRNVRGAFAAHPEWAGRGERVVLVDDVYTTGSTAAAAAAALRRAGATSVHVVTFARAVR